MNEAKNPPAFPDTNGWWGMTLLDYMAIRLYDNTHNPMDSQADFRRNAETAYAKAHEMLVARSQYSRK